MGLTSGRGSAAIEGASSGRGSVFCKSGHKLLLQKNNSHFAQEATADFGYSFAWCCACPSIVIIFSHGLKPLRDCGSCQ